MTYDKGTRRTNSSRVKKVFDWMFKVQEERLKQRGYPCDDNGQRTIVIDLSSNKE